MNNSKVVVLGRGSFARVASRNMAKMALMPSLGREMVLVIDEPSHTRDQVADMLNEIRGLEISLKPVTYRLHDHSVSKTTRCYGGYDPRFNAEPEKSTFTRKIHSKSKRW